jgi:N-acetylneuraminate synthase
MSACLLLESHKVGPGQPCFIVAEAGVNHNGDLELARRLVDAASAAGADAVKFQTFEPKYVVAADAPKADYQIRNAAPGRTQREMIEPLVLSTDAHRELQARAHARGLVFLSTPFDEPSADFLDELGVPAFKIPSGEVINHPLLARLARKGRPLLMSTGMCDLQEVAAAVKVIRAHGDPPLALFHCVSNYPAMPAECNLRAMVTLRDHFDVPTGWSDHTLGTSVSVAAVALGACLLEKHLTLDQTLSGPDHKASLEPNDFARLVQEVRAIESALGSGVKAPNASELAVARVARKSLHWAMSLPLGTHVEPKHLIALRPGLGLLPAQSGELLGRCLRRPVVAGTLVRLEDLEVLTPLPAAG